MEYMAGIASDDSDDDFDGYLLSEDDNDESGGKYTILFTLKTIKIR